MIKFQGKFRYALEVTLGKNPEYKFREFIYKVISAADQNCPVFQKQK